MPQGRSKKPLCEGGGLWVAGKERWLGWAARARMVCLGVADVYGVDLWVLFEKFGLRKGFWGDSGGRGGLWKVKSGQEGGGTC